MGNCHKNHAVILDLVGKNHSLTQIAEIIGTSRHRLIEYLRSNGIDYHGKTQRAGDCNSNWRGGKRIEDGYVYVYSPNHPNATIHKYVLEHRLVMEQHLGRYLDPREVVHHKDGDKKNNSIENLELFSQNSAHLSETLRGKKPNWTEEGIRNMRAGIDRSANKRRRRIQN